MLGTITGYEKCGLTYKALIAAKYAGVEVKFSSCASCDKSKAAPEFLAKFPFGKIPVFETADGKTLYESNAIAYYVASQKAGLVGANAFEAALVEQFLSVASGEIGSALCSWVHPLKGYCNFDASAVKAAAANAHKALAVVDKILLPRTFLVGEQVTLADIVLACSVMSAFESVLEASDRAKYVNLTRWFVTMVNQPEFKAVIGEFKMCEKAITAPKPVAAAPTPAATPAPAAQNAEEDAPVEPKKVKNPLDLLPPTTFNVNDWKRFYSNNDTRPTAIDYFWKNFDSQGYSIWWVDYKYNDELTKVFMTCNLVTGLFARLGKITDYSFGSFLIFGEDDKNEISGAMFFRGQEIPPEVKAVADYDSYTWRRMNLEDAAERELFEDYLAWDGKLNGKVVNQGKTFK